MINSQFLNGLVAPTEFIPKVIVLLEEKLVKKINYRLKIEEYVKDIGDVQYLSPMMKKNNVVKVPLEDLPVKLPEDIDLNSNGNPLNNHKNWKSITIKGKNVLEKQIS